jgi:hypothetical protein
MPVRSADVVPYAPSGPSLENPSPEWLDGGAAPPCRLLRVPIVGPAGPTAGVYGRAHEPPARTRWHCIPGRAGAGDYPCTGSDHRWRR